MEAMASFGLDGEEAEDVLIQVPPFILHYSRNSAKKIHPANLECLDT